MTKRILVPSAILIAVLIGICTQFTIFVVPPVGSLPTGMTVIFPRFGKTNFIDSPDAMCQRETGHAGLLCRGITVGAVAARGHIIARLPYSEALYQISLK